MKSIKAIAVLSGLTLAAAVGALRAEEPVASVHFGVSSILFSPKVSYAELSLTVVGPGVYEQQTLQPGKSVSFSGSVLQDGNYKYELVASPPFDQQAWEQAERDGDQAALDALERDEQAHTYRQTGSFKVVRGQILETEAGESNAKQN